MSDHFEVFSSKLWPEDDFGDEIWIPRFRFKICFAGGKKQPPTPLYDEKRININTSDCWESDKNLVQEKKLKSFWNTLTLELQVLLIFTLCWDEWEQMSTLKMTIASYCAPFAPFFVGVVYTSNILPLSCSSVNVNCPSEKEKPCFIWINTVWQKKKKLPLRIGFKQQKLFSITVL